MLEESQVSKQPLRQAEQIAAAFATVMGIILFCVVLQMASLFVATGPIPVAWFSGWKALPNWSFIAVGASISVGVYALFLFARQFQHLAASQFKRQDLGEDPPRRVNVLHAIFQVTLFWIFAIGVPAYIAFGILPTA
jgi:hypothetical protein